MQRTTCQMLVGGILLVFGWLVTFAMVLELIPSQIWLNMAAYGVTLVGFMIGIIGVVSHIRITLRNNRNR